MSSFSDKRIIKQISNEPLKHKEKKMHPITLEEMVNKDTFGRDVLFTQFSINKNEPLIFNYDTTNDVNIKKYRNDKDNLLIPNLSLPLSDILLIYDISNYEE